MENYQHAVFFKAKSLSDEELRQIQIYFKIKRRSGGGDCEIYKVGNSTYKISFRNKNGKHVFCYCSLVLLKPMSWFYLTYACQNNCNNCNNCKNIPFIIMTVHYSHQNAFVFKAQERVLERNHHVIRVEGQEDIHVLIRHENVAESSEQPTASVNQVNGTVTKQTEIQL